MVVDLPDSSTFVTAINVFERLQIRPHLLYVEPRLALEMLRKGEVDAIVTIEGKPLPWLNQLTDRNLHLVPVEYAKPLREEYLPSKITAADYPNLVPEGGHVDTIAAEAVLASYNWAAEHRPLSPLVAAGRIRCSPGSRNCSGRRSIPSGRSSRLRASVEGWTRFEGGAGMARPQSAANRRGGGGLGRRTRARSRAAEQRSAVSRLLSGGGREKASAPTALAPKLAAKEARRRTMSRLRSGRLRLGPAAWAAGCAGPAQATPWRDQRRRKRRPTQRRR